MGGEWNFIHSPPIFRAQSCLTDAVIVIFPDYCFTDTHLMARGTFTYASVAINAIMLYAVPL